MARPRSNPESLNVVHRVDTLLTRHDYAGLMLSRAVADFSPALLATMERDGLIRLDYMQVGNQFFIADTAENEAKMAAAQAARFNRRQGAWRVGVDRDWRLLDAETARQGR